MYRRRRRHSVTSVASTSSVVLEREDGSPNRLTPTSSEHSHEPTKEGSDCESPTSGKGTKSFKTRGRDRLNSVTSSLAATRDKVSKARHFSLTGVPRPVLSATKKHSGALQRPTADPEILGNLPALPVFQRNKDERCAEKLYKATLDVLVCTGRKQTVESGTSYVNECLRKKAFDFTQNSPPNDHIPITVGVAEAVNFNKLITANLPSNSTDELDRSQLFWRALVLPLDNRPASSLRVLRDKRIKSAEPVTSASQYSEHLVSCSDSPKWNTRVQLKATQLPEEALLIQIWRADEMKPSESESDNQNRELRRPRSSSFSRREKHKIDKSNISPDLHGRSSSMSKPRMFERESSKDKSDGPSLRQRLRSFSSGKMPVQKLLANSDNTSLKLIANTTFPLEELSGGCAEVDKWITAYSPSEARDSIGEDDTGPKIRLKVGFLLEKAVPKIPGLSNVDVYLLTLETFLEHERQLAMYQQPVSVNSSSIDVADPTGYRPGTPSSVSSQDVYSRSVLASGGLSEMAQYILQQVEVLREISKSDCIMCHWKIGTRPLVTSEDFPTESSHEDLNQTLYATRLIRDNMALIKGLPADKLEEWKNSLEEAMDALVERTRQLTPKVILSSGVDNWELLARCAECTKAICDIPLFKSWFPSASSAKKQILGAIKEATKEWYLSTIEIAGLNEKNDFEAHCKLTKNMTTVLNVCATLAGGLEEREQAMNQKLLDIGVSFCGTVRRNLIKWISADTPAVVTISRKFCVLSSTGHKQKLAIMSSLRKMFSACSEVWPQKVLQHGQISEGSYGKWFEAPFIRWHNDFANVCKEQVTNVVSSEKAHTTQELTMMSGPPLMCLQAAQELTFVVEVLLSDYKSLLTHPVLEHAFSSAECMINTVFTTVQSVITDHWLQQLTVELNSAGKEQVSMETVAAILNSIHYCISCVIRKLPTFLDLNKLSENAFRARLEFDSGQFPDVLQVFRRMLDSTCNSLEILAYNGLKQLANSIVSEDALPHFHQLQVNQVDTNSSQPLQEMVTSLSQIFSNLRKALPESYMPKLVSYIWRALLSAVEELLPEEEAEGTFPVECLSGLGKDGCVFGLFDQFLEDKEFLETAQYQGLMKLLEGQQHFDPVDVVLSYTHENNQAAKARYSLTDVSTAATNDWGSISVEAAWVTKSNADANGVNILAVKLAHVTGLQTIATATIFDKIFGRSQSSAQSKAECFYVTVSLTPEVFFQERGSTAQLQHTTTPFNGTSAILDQTYSFAVPTELSSLCGVGVMFRAFQNQTMAFKDPFIGQAFLELVDLPSDSYTLEEMSQHCSTRRLQLHLPVENPMSMPHWNNTFRRHSTDMVVSKFLAGEQAWMSRAKVSMERRRSSVTGTISTPNGHENVLASHTPIEPNPTC